MLTFEAMFNVALFLIWDDMIQQNISLFGAWLQSVLYNAHIFFLTFIKGTDRTLNYYNFFVYYPKVNKYTDSFFGNTRRQPNLIAYSRRTND